MNFSISSANMTILISNIFIFLLFLIFRNQKVRFNLGLPILIGFIFLTINEQIQNIAQKKDTLCRRMYN